MERRGNRRRGEESSLRSVEIGRLVGVLLVSLVWTFALACQSQSGFDEAVEEVEDEAQDLKRNVSDEIDDHT
jgi:hypothetical protein